MTDKVEDTVIKNSRETFFENKIIRFGTEFFITVPFELASSLTIKDGDTFEISVMNKKNLVIRKKLILTKSWYSVREFFAI